MVKGEYPDEDCLRVCKVQNTENQALQNIVLEFLDWFHAVHHKDYCPSVLIDFDNLTTKIVEDLFREYNQQNSLFHACFRVSA